MNLNMTLTVYEVTNAALVETLYPSQYSNHGTVACFGDCFYERVLDIISAMKYKYVWSK